MEEQKQQENEKEVKISVTLDAAAISEFMLYHIYSGPVGMAVLFLGILNAVLTYVFALKKEAALTVVFAVFALLLLLCFPFVIRNRISALQSSRKFVKPAVYSFSDQGIRTESTDKTRQVDWKDLKKAVTRKHILILYDAQKRAMVIPLEQLGEHYGTVAGMIRSYTKGCTIRIRRSPDRRRG